jgi:hypothetical protein
MMAAGRGLLAGELKVHDRLCEPHRPAIQPSHLPRPHLRGAGLVNLWFEVFWRVLITRRNLLLEL